MGLGKNHLQACVVLRLRNSIRYFLFSFLLLSLFLCLIMGVPSPINPLHFQTTATIGFNNVDGIGWKNVLGKCPGEGWRI